MHRRDVHGVAVFFIQITVHIERNLKVTTTIEAKLLGFRQHVGNALVGAGQWATVAV